MSGRPNIENDPRYVELVQRIAPSKQRIAEAKEIEKQRVKEAIERERVALLHAAWDAWKAGLSRYAVGKATGFTSKDAKERLYEEARAMFGGNGYVPKSGPIGSSLPEVSFTMDGWTLTLTDLDKRPEGRFDSTWRVTGPDTAYDLTCNDLGHEDIEGTTEDEFAEMVGQMPFDLHAKLLEWKP